MAWPGARWRWRWFCAWALVGAGYAFGVLSLLTIGVYVLTLSLVATIVLARSSVRRAGAVGVVAGLGLPLLYVAYLNRGGPGTVCTSTATETSCVDAMSPWPWTIVGVCLLLAGILVFARMVRARTGPTPH